MTNEIFEKKIAERQHLEDMRWEMLVDTVSKDLDINEIERDTRLQSPRGKAEDFLRWRKSCKQ